MMEIPNFYEGDYKKLVLIPLLLLLPSLYFALHVQPGLEFKGGVLVTLELEKPISEQELSGLLMDNNFHDFKVRAYTLGDTPIAEVELAHSDDMNKLESLYRKYLDLYDEYSKKQYQLVVLKTSNQSYSDVEKEVDDLAVQLESIRSDFSETAYCITGKSYTLKDDKESLQQAYSDVMDIYRNSIVSKLRSVVSFKDYSFKLVSPSLSELFVSKIESIMITAGVLSALAVFLLFRDTVPSLAVLIGATSDIIFALGFMGLMGIPLTLATIASILMLVGYSLDTDILITVRILKRGLKNPRMSAFEAFKTGVTMSLTSILAFASLYFVGQFTNIEIYQQISEVVLAGLVGDIIATWLLNAVIMLYHVEGVNRAHSKVVA